MVGGQRAKFVVRELSQSVFPNYENNGFSQQVHATNEGLEISVEVTNQPLNSRLKARRVGPLPRELASLARELDRQMDGGLVDQVALVFHWLRNEIAYLEDENGLPQDAQSVVIRRSGNCVGFCNAAIAILQQMGLQARAVTGVAFKREDSVRLRLAGQVLHRWIELDYPDVGPVFCDPSGKIHFVEATYVVLAVHQLHPIQTAMDAATGAEIELLSLEDGMRRVSRRNDLDGRLVMRPNVLVAPLRPE